MNPRHVLACLHWSTHKLDYGIRAYAREADWTLSFMRNAADYPHGSRKVDGLLVFPGHTPVDFRKLYPNAKIVNLRGLGDIPSADASTRIDHEQVSRLAADYLSGSGGYRHFLGFGCKRVEPIVTRIDTFCRYLARRGYSASQMYLNYWPEQIVIDPGDLRARIHRIVKKNGLPLAVFAPDDAYAEAFIQTALDLGYRIPQDIAVLGVNNSREICEACRVPVSSIDVNFSRLGYEGARLLDGLMKGEITAASPAGERHLVIPPLTIEKRQSTDSAAESDKAVVAIQQYIREHFAERISLETVLQDLRLSRSTVFARFTHAVGHPIGKEITRVRMDHARYLLAETDYKIDAVARMSGYENTSAFCRLFKRLHQQSPAAWRRQQ
ncbi:transcriptional regulator [Opitutaceae bacterium TAV5]|nr:transcriptional regulator [Opitutaceae bacterium TAV5]